MTRTQRIRNEIMLAKKAHPLGVDRTAHVAAIKKRYHLTDGGLRKLCLNVAGCAYWA
jgi:hypothetical protein